MPLDSYSLMSVSDAPFGFSSLPALLGIRLPLKLLEESVIWLICLGWFQPDLEAFEHGDECCAIYKFDWRGSIA